MSVHIVDIPPHQGGPLGTEIKTLPPEDIGRGGIKSKLTLFKIFDRRTFAMDENFPLYLVYGS